MTDSLIRAQAYLDAKQDLVSRTGKNTRGKLNCKPGNKQCGGRCIPNDWDCRLEGKGTNSELKAHSFDPLGGVESIERGVTTIVKNPGDYKSYRKGRDSIIRGIVKATPGDNLEEKKKLKRRLQKYGNQIGAVVLSTFAIGASHAALKRLNPGYRRGLGNQIDRAAFSAVDQVLNRLPVIGPGRAADRARAAATFNQLGRAVTGGNARERLIEGGATFTSGRMGAISRIGTNADFRGTGTRDAINALNKQAREGKLSYDQWTKAATQVVYGAEVQRGKEKHSVFSEDAANRLLTRQFGLSDLADGTLQRTGSRREGTQAQANNEVISKLAGKFDDFKSAMKRDMDLRRIPREKNGDFSAENMRKYVDTVVVPKMNLTTPGMSALQQNSVKRQGSQLAQKILNSKGGTGADSTTGIALARRSSLIESYDQYFGDVASNMRSVTDVRSKNYLFGDGETGLARFVTTQMPNSGDVAPRRITSREHGRLILRDYYERKVMEGANGSFKASDATVQRVASQLMVKSGPGTIDRATAYSVVQNSGIRSLAGPPEVKPYGSTTRTKSKSAGRAKAPVKTGLSAAQRQTELAKSIMKRESFTGTLAEAYAQARKEIQRGDSAPRGDDEHMSPTITKRNPPSPLVTNSTPTVVNGPTDTEHLPSDEDEMVTPLMPVSKMSESPTPKEAEQQAEEEPRPAGKPIKLSFSVEIPAEALAAKRSDAYEAEKLRLREDATSGKSSGKGKKCGESHIPSKHECTIGAGGAALKGSNKESKIAAIREKGKTESFEHTNEKGERTGAYRARQVGSALARAGFTVGTGVLAVKTAKQDPMAAAGLALASLFGAKSLKRELTVTRSNKDLVKDFSSLKGLEGVEDATIDQMVGFVQESGIDVQRVKTAALAGGIKGYFDTAQPNRVHTSAGESELNMSRTGQQKKLYKGKTDAETMAGGVQSMIAQREAYYNGPERRKLLAGQAQSVEDLYELHSTGQFVGTSKARALYTNAHEIAHAIHYRGDFATPKSVTVNGKVYTGTDLEIELIKSSSYYGQSDIRRKASGKVDNYYDTGSRLETYAENYAMYVGGGAQMKKSFPVAYEWTKQTTDYALSQPVKKPARTFSSVVEELVVQGERQYIKDRLDAPKPQEQKLQGDDLLLDLYPKVQAAAVKGDVKAFAELLGQAMQGELEEDQMQIFNDYIETVRMYEVIDGRARPENQGEQGFAEQGDDEEEQPKQEEEKTDARRDAYMATRFAWT